MLGRVVNLEDYDYLWIKGFDLQPGKIAFGIKTQAINPARQLLLHKEERLDTPVLISPCMA